MIITTTLTTLLVGAALVTAIALYFWPQIAWFFRKHLIPWFRKTLGNSVADLVAQLFSYVDDAMCWGRQKIKAAWNWLVGTILKEDTTYEEKNSSTYTATTETYVKEENSDNVKVVTHTRTVPYQELPIDVRHEMNRRNLQKFKVDDREILANKLRDAAKEKEGLSSHDVLDMSI